MRLVGFLAALLAAQGSFCAASPPYQHRREELRKALKNGITVVFGRSAHDSSDLRSGFFQEPNFYYLTGWMEPGAILLLAPKEPREILFVPRRDPDEEVWTGRKHGPDEEDIRALTGFETVMPAEKFESEFHRLLEQYSKLYALTDRPEAARLKALAPLRDLSNAAPEIAKLRMEKSPEELAIMQHAVDVTLAAHRAAWTRAAPGLYEYQIAATMEGVY